MWLVFVFELFMLCTAVAGECHCYDARACTSSPATTCRPHGGCIEGWHGPTCQKQNVALKKRISYPLNPNLTVDYVVDGIAFNDSVCAQTDNEETLQKLEIDLNTSNHDKIYHMKLYLDKTRKSGSTTLGIRVDGRYCYYFDQDQPDSILDVTCVEPLAGRHVDIYKVHGFSPLCEVQIFVCSDGWFDDDCDKQCHCLVEEEICNKITGHCISGCSLGFSGTKCQSRCSDGWFGYNCDTQCRCSDNKEACDKTSGHCSSGCAPGFSGVNCQTQNVALKRKASQSCNGHGRRENSQSLNQTADYLVDGIISNHSSSPCPHTDGGDMTPSWTVVLNTSKNDDIQRMKLYHCVNSTSSNDGIEINVDGHPCYFDAPTESPHSIMEVTCKEPLAGNSVTIRRPQEFLSLCEVQIFVCSDGWFGDDCDKQCHCLDKKEVCDKTTGECSSGCTSGFQGSQCQLPCRDGWFGENCREGCHCSNNEVCSKVAGHCPSRCSFGFSGTNCQTENVALIRPANQTSKANYWENTVNYAVDGYLWRGKCAQTHPGDTNPSWTVYLERHDKIHHIKLYLSEMSQGQSRNYGMEILVDDQICYNWSSTEQPSSIEDVTCRQPLSGTYVTIRTPQENLTLCEVEIFVCSNGWFGDDCDKQCRCRNDKEVCDKITGHCSSGCSHGFSGTNCHSVCSDGWFGDDCDKQCHCLDNKEVCDKTTGQCSSGCAPGFSGTDCQTFNCQHEAVNNENQDQPAAYLLTLAVPVSCGVVMLAIVLVASLCIRRLRVKIKTLEKTRQEPYVPLDQATREEMPEPCYSVIADNRHDPRYMNSSV